MKAMFVTGSAQGPVLVPGQTERPVPGPGELLIRVYAAGVTTSELLWYPTSHRKDGQERQRGVPGHEFSGVVAGLGEDCGDFATGDLVFGMNDWFADGAMAEFCIAHHSAVARKPAVLSHTEAASVPIGALTAAQGLFDRAKLRAGESVLVHGGSGAVGVFAVQLAKLHGGRVIATASGRNLEFVTRLGAERVVDYRERRWETALPRVDVVFDTAGGETLDRSWAMLKPHGRIVTVAASAENATKERVKKAFFIVEPDGKRLAETGELVSAGRLKPVVDAVFPLDQAPEVFAERVVRHGRGKLVIAVQECDG